MWLGHNDNFPGQTNLHIPTMPYVFDRPFEEHRSSRLFDTGGTWQKLSMPAKQKWDNGHRISWIFDYKFKFKWFHYTDGRIVRTQRFFETKVRTHSKLEPTNFKIGSKFHFFLHKWLKIKKSLSRPCSRLSGKLCTKCCISYIKRTLDLTGLGLWSTGMYIYIVVDLEIEYSKSNGPQIECSKTWTDRILCQNKKQVFGHVSSLFTANPQIQRAGKCVKKKFKRTKLEKSNFSITF